MALKELFVVNVGVLIERVHYYTILVEGVRTIREGVLIEEGALTEVVQYLGCFIFIFSILNVMSKEIVKQILYLIFLMEIHSQFSEFSVS